MSPKETSRLLVSSVLSAADLPLPLLRECAEHLIHPFHGPMLPCEASPCPVTLWASTSPNRCQLTHVI